MCRQLNETATMNNDSSTRAIIHKHEVKPEHLQKVGGWVSRSVYVGMQEAGYVSTWVCRYVGQ